MNLKANHQVKIVRINELIPHTNAESLELIEVEGYQVVVKKGEFKVNDLAVYIQPDSVVPQTEPFRFIWEGQVGIDGVVPDKRRRITVRKFRGEWSEGLLLPISDFFASVDTKNGIYYVSTIPTTTTQSLKEGDEVSELLGITHYTPPEPTEGQGTTTIRIRKYPKSLKGWFYFLLHKLGLGWGKAGQSVGMEVNFTAPVYDVDALKNYKNVFQDGEPVIITEKIHGSNARYVFIDGKMYSGSHYQWKHPDSDCVFTKALKDNPWIQSWCELNPGYTLYGEITPTQKGFEYGKKTIQFFCFDILTPDGEWKKPYKCANTDFYFDNVPPLIYNGTYSKAVLELADGKSLVPGANNIREGIVISPLVERKVRGLGRVQLKVVSNKYYERDSK